MHVPAELVREIASLQKTRHKRWGRVIRSLAHSTTKWLQSLHLLRWTLRYTCVQLTDCYPCPLASLTSAKTSSVSITDFTCVIFFKMGDSCVSASRTSVSEDYYFWSGHSPAQIPWDIAKISRGFLLTVLIGTFMKRLALWSAAASFVNYHRTFERVLCHASSYYRVAHNRAPCAENKLRENLLA